MTYVGPPTAGRPREAGHRRGPRGCLRLKGRITVNGKALDEPVHHCRCRPPATPTSTWCAGQPLWVMGDNRPFSEDSPAPRAGGASRRRVGPRRDVVGRVVLVVYPLSRWARMPVPDTFHDVPTRAPDRFGVSRRTLCDMAAWLDERRPASSCWTAVTASCCSRRFPARPENGRGGSTLGGGLEVGEDAEAAALRELREETGLNGVALEGPGLAARRRVRVRRPGLSAVRGLLRGPGGHARGRHERLRRPRAARDGGPPLVVDRRDGPVRTT